MTTPLPNGTKVHVSIDGKITDSVLLDSGWLYQVEGKDGRRRWVPEYNLTPTPVRP